MAVHLRATYAPALSLPRLAERVRRAARAAADALGAGPLEPVDVAVDDLQLGAAPEGAPPAAPGREGGDA